MTVLGHSKFRSSIPEKAHSSRCLGCTNSTTQKQKKLNPVGAQLHAYQKKPQRIRIKLCLLVGIRDVVKCTKFGDDQLRGLGMGRGQTSHCSIDLSGPP